MNLSDTFVAHLEDQGYDVGQTIEVVYTRLHLGQSREHSAIGRELFTVDPSEGAPVPVKPGFTTIVQADLPDVVKVLSINDDSIIEVGRLVRLPEGEA